MIVLFASTDVTQILILTFWSMFAKRRFFSAYRKKWNSVLIIVTLNTVHEKSQRDHKGIEKDHVPLWILLCQEKQKKKKGWWLFPVTAMWGRGPVSFDHRPRWWRQCCMLSPDDSLAVGGSVASLPEFRGVPSRSQFLWAVEEVNERERTGFWAYYQPKK